MLMIRLSRMGARKQPHYRIVVIEKARARNGRPVEVVGTYNPRTNPASIDIQARARGLLGIEGRTDVGAGEQAVLQASRRSAGSRRIRFARLSEFRSRFHSENLCLRLLEIFVRSSS